MGRKITDISDPGGEIRQILDFDRFISMVKALDVFDEANFTQKDVDKAQLENKAELIDKKIKVFANLANQELHEYLKNCELLERKKDARDNKRKIDFPLEIEKSARDFQELVRKSPPIIANNPELLEMSEQLEAVPHIFDELRQKPHLAELGMIDPYGGQEMDLRVDLILGLHALYSDLSGRGDWHTLHAYDESKSTLTNPFFQLVRLCYKDAGLDRADSTISGNITKAKGIGRSEN